MFCYFKQRWELLVDTNTHCELQKDQQLKGVNTEEEDVCSNKDDIAGVMSMGDVRGMDKNVFQDC